MDNIVVVEKFKSYVRKCISNLSSKRIELVSNIECIKQLDVVSDKSSIEDLLSVKEYILKIEPKLANDFKILEFFSAKNTTNIPQVKSSFNNILLVVNKRKLGDTKELRNHINAIDKTVIQYNNYLNGSRFDTKVIIELLESSELNIEEQIIILSNIAYNMSPSIVKEDKKVVVEEKKVTVDNTMYLDILATAKNILVKYYDVLATKTPQEMRDIINISNIIGSMSIEDVKSYYKKQIVFEGLIYRIKLMVSELTEALKINNSNKDDLYLELEEAIESLNGITLDREGNKDNPNTNILFLIDDNGNPLFTINYDRGELSKIDALLSKLINIPGEIANGRLVQNTWLETNKIKVYVRSFSDMCCAYLKMTDNKILIVDIAPLNDVYSETVNIIRRNQDVINKIMEQVRTNNEELYANQEMFLERLQDSLKGSGR